MRKLLIFGIFCLAAVLRAAPATGDDDDDDDEKVIIPKRLFDKTLIKYRAKHDIVDILVPLNALNFDDSSSDSSSDSKSDSNEDLTKDVTIFFVQADVKDGKRIDHGLYRYKNGKAKLILIDGRTAAASTNDKELVFFGASDGLYINDLDSDWAVKYGPITDGIISIATDGTGKTIYIVTDDHKLYEVTNNGVTKKIIDNVDDVQEIVLDDLQNIYYYNSNKEVFIRTVDGVIQVQDLPPNPKTLKLIRPPFVMEDGVPLMSDDSLYFVFANGTSEASHIEFSPGARPTAYGPEAVLVQYYAFNKKLYEFNIMQLFQQDIFENIKDKTETIRSTAERTRNTLGSKKE